MSSNGQVLIDGDNGHGETPPSPRGRPLDELAGTPPHDMQAEQGTLGGLMLLKPDAAEAEDTFDVIATEKDFYRPAHQMTFAVIRSRFDLGEPFDAITVAAELDRRGELDRVGGASYLHTLIASVPTAANTGHYARIVADKAVLRRLGEAGVTIVQLAHGPGDTDVILDRAGALFTAAATGRDLDEGVTVESVVAASFDEWLTPTIGFNGLRTGFTDLDEVLGGLRPGQLIIIAARPGFGKSTAGMDIARAVARAGESVHIASLEMNRNELTERMVCAEVKINLKRLRDRTLTEDEKMRLVRHLPDVMAMPVTIDDRAHMTVQQIRSGARATRRRRGLALLVVDYLQEVKGALNRRYENRQLEVTECVQSFKQLGRELAVPVVCLAQLNRQPEQRADGKPKISDLRESGAIEQEADIVILLHREDQVDKESARTGEADFLIEKNRNGPKGIVTVAAQMHYSRFVDMAAGGDMDVPAAAGETANVTPFRRGE